MFSFKPSAPPPPKPKPTPPLVKITSPTAAEVVKAYPQDPQAAQLLKPGQTPAQYVDALKANNQTPEAINFLAHGMPPREGVHWACRSTDTVASQLGPADQQALQAAKAWTANPNPQTQQAAASAAAKTDYQSPAAWAAQGAAWAPPGGGPVPAGAPNLPAKAVAGSVQLAAAQSATPAKPSAPQAPGTPTLPTAPKAPTAPKIPQPTAPAPPTPLDAAKIAAIQSPYVDSGIQIASGQDRP